MPPDLPPELPDEPNMIAIGPAVRLAGDRVRVQFSRSSGPGGQNVNKLNTRCEIWVRVGDLEHLTEPAAARLRQLAGSRLTSDDHLHIAADATRSQERNREAALQRLRELVLRALVAPKPRIARKPSRNAKRRRLEAKKRRSEVKSNRRGTFE